MVMNPSYEWMHSLSDVMNALIGAGLRIEFLHEFPYINYQHFPFMEEVKPGQWRIKGIDMPLAFSLKAAKVP